MSQARQEVLDVHGPYAPDTVFMRARQKPGGQREFDVVVAKNYLSDGELAQL
jgi:4-hydroxythreonine-4-phosphate dehydrogenase